MKEIDELLNNLPDIEADADFVSQLHTKLIQKTETKVTFRFNLNYFVAFSFIFFIFSLFSSSLIIYESNRQKTVTIELTQRENPNLESAQNHVFIYDENEHLKEVIADYKIKNDKLSVNLYHGNYRVVIASNKFENLATSLTIN